MTPTQLREIIERIALRAIEKEMKFVLGRLDNILAMCAREHPESADGISHARNLFSLYQQVYEPKASLFTEGLRLEPRVQRTSADNRREANKNSESAKARWRKYHETMRERDDTVLRLVAEGKTYREVAASFQISTMTVNNILRRRRTSAAE